MGKQSGKRHASTGNPLPNVEVNGQIEASPTVNNGDGQDGSVGLEASGNDSAESQALDTGLVSLGDFESIIRGHNSVVRADIINRAWHPEAAAGANVQTNVSDVPLLEGNASYQLSTGEIVEL
jgi:hypothetical protein